MPEPENSPHPNPARKASLAEAAWFNQSGIRAIFEALEREGQEIRIVGGAVRNALLDRPVKDVDFATTATPDEVMDMAGRAGLKTVPTGFEHGTVTVIVGGKPFEVTTLREDVETDGRRAQVRFTRDWEKDAQRRDFTINALYAGSDGRIYDPLGGQADLAAARIRFIGDARQRIREDYLRILRFFRFNAEYGQGEFDRAGLDAAVVERAGLEKLSAERVRMEMLRLLAAPRAEAALQVMADFGFLAEILHGVPRLGVFHALTEIELALNQSPDPIRRLAALAVLTEEDAERLSQKLRLSNSERQRLLICAGAALIRHLPSEKEAKVMLYRLGREAYEDRVMLAWALSGAAPDDPAWRALLLLPERWRPPAFPVTGADLLTLGGEKGPLIGEILKELEKKWIESEFGCSREMLLEAARQRLSWKHAQRNV